MKRIKIMGLCLVAMVAFSAVAAGSAFASERPEYKTCVQQAKNATKEYEGVYSGKYCRGSEEAATVATEGKYERGEVAEGAPEGKFVAKGGKKVEVSPGVFEKQDKEAAITIGSKTVTCKKSETTGDVHSQFNGVETITLSKCALPNENEETKPGKFKSVKIPCTTAGQEPGTIKTSELSQQLYYTNEEENAKGFAAYNEEGEPIASFACATLGGPTSFAVEGFGGGSVENTGKSQVFTFGTESFWFAETELLTSFLEAGGETVSISLTQEQSPYISKAEKEALKVEGKKTSPVGIF